MYQTSIRIILFFATILLVSTFNSPLSGQNRDNTHFDRVPDWVYDSVQNWQSRDNRSSTVVTIDGYDNFFLGTDFAESHIAENPNQPQHYFAVFNTDASYYTMDGHDWEETQPFWGTTIRGDVLSAYDSVGNLYYENMYGSPSIQGCKVVVSSDGGQTWGPAVTAINGVDKNWMAADQTGGPYSNYVYSVMTGSGGGNFSRTTDFGVTWQQTASMPTQSLPGMMVCVGPDGNIQGGSVYVVTNGGSTTASTYTFYRSLDGGDNFTQMSSQQFSGYVGTFTGGRHSVNNMRTRPYPFIAADNSYGDYRGRLYLVYAKNDPPGSGNKPDIWCRYSDDGGTSFSDAVRVNDDLFAQNNHQFAPAIWCDKETGRLYIQWMDSREDPASEYAKIYATYSDDGGESFAQNQAVSNEEMIINCTTCGGGGSPRYQGDYNGIVSNDNVSMVVWSDFRDGKFDSYVGYFPDFAMTLEPEVLSITTSDTIYANVPDVKLYDDIVLFNTSIEQPPSGSLSFSYPEGFTLNELPGSLPIVVTASGGAPPGDYDITITGKGPNGTPVHKRFGTITVLPSSPPTADFEASETVVCAGSSIDFSDLSQNSPTSWDWLFPGGDPETSTAQNPEGVVYNDPGIYSVSLEVFNNAGSDLIIKEEYITVNVIPEPPVADDQQTCSGSTVPDLVAEGENVVWYEDPELTTVIFEGPVFATGQTDPGTFSYYATQTAEGCESDPDTVTLIINPTPEVLLLEFMGLCADAEPMELTGGTPEGGDYFGTAVSEGMFDPAVSGTGTFVIGYVYANDFGCSDTAFSTITVHMLPEVSLTGPGQLCINDDTYALEGGLPEGGVYSGPGVDAGEFDPSVAGIGEHVIAYEYTDLNGCFGSAETTIEVLPLPGKPEAINGPAEVDTYSVNSSDFTTEGAENADSYSWAITPENAGTISPEGTTVSIEWDPEFTGVVTLDVTPSNSCGNGEVSDQFQVTVYSSLGIGEYGSLSKLRVYPNPNYGSFTIEVVEDTEISADIRLTSQSGEILLEKNNVKLTASNSKSIAVTGYSPGIYILSIITDDFTDYRKIILK